jgi:hypothetical protein
MLPYPYSPSPRSTHTAIPTKEGHGAGARRGIDGRLAKTLVPGIARVVGSRGWAVQAVDGGGVSCAGAVAVGAVGVDRAGAVVVFLVEEVLEAFHGFVG